MDPRAVLQPVGPLPARVYWLRRLVPLAVLLVLILAIALSCSGGATPRRPAAAGGGSSPSASPSPSGPAAPCAPAGLEVTASTDASKYAPGVQPRLVMTVRNAGLTTCAIDDGPSRRSWTIVSGTDQIWSTAGCATSKTVTRRVLAAGASLRHTFIWNRHRSGTNCATSDTTAAPGTYLLTVTVGGVRSAPAIFHLTG